MVKRMREGDKATVLRQVKNVRVGDVIRDAQTPDGWCQVQKIDHHDAEYGVTYTFTPNPSPFSYEAEEWLEVEARIS